MTADGGEPVGSKLWLPRLAACRRPVERYPVMQRNGAASPSPLEPGPPVSPTVT